MAMTTVISSVFPSLSIVVEVEMPFFFFQAESAQSLSLPRDRSPPVEAGECLFPTDVNAPFFFLPPGQARPVVLFLFPMLHTFPFFPGVRDMEELPFLTFDQWPNPCSLTRPYEVISLFLFAEGITQWRVPFFFPLFPTF